MTKKWMTLALALVAPAVFGQTSTTVPAVRVKKAKHAMAAPAQAGQTKVLRDEIKRDKTDLAAKRKAARAERVQLGVQEKAELAKIKGSTGTRAEKSAARKALREKYARLMKDAASRSVFERKQLREDIAGKKAQIQKLRRS